MDEYGLVLEPEHPDGAFEALSDVTGTNVFTHAEAIAAMSEVLGISGVSAESRFDALVRNGNIQELI